MARIEVDKGVVKDLKVLHKIMQRYLNDDIKNNKLDSRYSRVYRHIERIWLIMRNEYEKSNIENKQ